MNGIALVKNNYQSYLELLEKAINEHGRTQGIYPHHLTQWKQAFMSAIPDNKTNHYVTEIKQLKTENKALKKELTRKEKALAETAALLVLKKKVHAIWGSVDPTSPAIRRQTIKSL